jgi:hypothetical protein
MRSAVAVVVLLGSVVGCTSGSAQTTSPSISGLGASAEPVVVEPDTCPKMMEFFLKRNDVKGMQQALVPGQPRYLVACDGRLRVVTTDEHQVAAAARALNDLKLIPPNVVFNCAFFGRTRDRGLFFTYSNGDVLVVQIGAACGTATNGYRQAFLRGLSWRDLSALHD